jgi:hypothetical protein
MRGLMIAGLTLTLAMPLQAQAGHQMGQPGQKKEPAGMGHQMGGQGQGMGMGMEMGLPGPLRSLGGYAPDKVLAMKEMLELTADQEAKLTALAGSAKKAGEDAHAPAMAAMQNLRKEMEKATPDKDVMHQLLVAHATAEGNMQWVTVDAAMQTKALLTEAQRKHVEMMKYS